MKRERERRGKNTGCVASRGTARDRERKSAVSDVCSSLGSFFSARSGAHGASAWDRPTGSPAPSLVCCIATKKNRRGKKYRGKSENVFRSRKIEKKKKKELRPERERENREVFIDNLMFITLIYKFNELFLIFRALGNHFER